jgi:hypothetical protein
MTFAVNGFNPAVVSNQPNVGAAASPSRNSVANLLQDLASLLESADTTGVPSYGSTQEGSMPSTDAQMAGNSYATPSQRSFGPLAGPLADSYNSSNQNPFAEKDSPDLSALNQSDAPSLVAQQPQLLADGTGGNDAAQAVGPGPGTTDLRRVSLQMPNSNGVPLFQGPKNADGSTDLYSTDGDGKGIQHRGVLNADGSVTFDNQYTMGLVVDFNGHGIVDTTANSDGTFTVAAGQTKLVAGDLSDS